MGTIMIGFGVLVAAFIGWGFVFPGSAPGRLLRIGSAKVNTAVGDVEARNALALDKQELDRAAETIAAKKTLVAKFGGTVNVIREGLNRLQETLKAKNQERDQVLDLLDDYEEPVEGESADEKQKRERLFTQAEKRATNLTEEINELTGQVEQKKTDLAQAEASLQAVLKDIEEIADGIEAAERKHITKAGRLQAAELRRDIAQTRSQLDLSGDGIIGAVEGSSQRLSEQIARVEGEASTTSLLDQGGSDSKELDDAIAARKTGGDLAALRAARREQRSGAAS